jgi:hypothetical protein
MFNILFHLQFLTPFITIPIAWRLIQNKTLAVFVGLLVAVLLSFLFNVIRGILFIL